MGSRRVLYSLAQRPASDVWLTMTAKEGGCVYSAAGRQAGSSAGVTMRCPDPTLCWGDALLVICPYALQQRMCCNSELTMHTAFCVCLAVFGVQFAA